MTDANLLIRRGCVLGAALASMTLSACAVGPDYTPAPAPDATRFTREPTVSPGNGQIFAQGAEAPPRWWKAYRSEALDALVEEALAKSPTLEAAEAAIRAADATASAQEGAFFPQVSGMSSSTRSSAGGGAPTNLFTKQLNASFTPDIWGANARAVESLEAQAERARLQLAAARLTLAHDVVVAAIEEASLRSQIATTQKLVAIQQENLALLTLQHSLGAASGLDLASQEAALAQTRQSLPGLDGRLAAQRNRLTALAGRYPSQEIDETFALSELALPKELPLRLPAQVVEKRPDILQAATDVHGASADVGVAVAARLPNVTLTADTGASALKLAQLFAPGTGFYTLAGTVSQPIFQGMTLLNRQRAAEARLEEAKARYRETVIGAFQNVADSLRALQADARSVRAARLAEAAARRFLDQTRAQRKYGGVSQLAVLTAQQSYLNASMARVRAEVSRLSDVAALFTATGG
ncbi:efflux transporter outer membrane subunit [Methylosinus sp. LW4]|uniref:efflux transporter outer membrane subunit n=1 Tax=Methylosinus sp. LW4 TaxID=136993 RepID=UPI0003AAD468|nr:efflux transporter outer membrane subunit [Methylosinus sp. LW4]